MILHIWLSSVKPANPHGSPIWEWATEEWKQEFPEQVPEHSQAHILTAQQRQEWDNGDGISRTELVQKIMG